MPGWKKYDCRKCGKMAAFDQITEGQFIYVFISDIYVDWASSASSWFEWGPAQDIQVKQNLFRNTEYERSPQHKLQFTHKMFDVYYITKYITSIT